MVVWQQLLKVASLSPITTWDGRIEGSLTESLDRELNWVVSFSSPLTAVVM